MNRLLIALVLPLLVPAQEPPAAYPRPGATRVLENDDVIIWDIAWLQQEYPLHRHRYDHVGVYYAPGDRIITSPEGERRPVSTEAWNISFQLRGVTHTEQGASDEPLRAVFIQMKREPGNSAEGSAGPAEFPADTPTERLDNDRVHVWEYGPASSASPQRHRHAHDAVAVSFDASNQPSVRFVEEGTVHDTDLIDGSLHTFVFEIK
jgi:hypothetical protein